MASVMNFVETEDAGLQRKPISRTPSTASPVHVWIGLIPMFDFIDENNSRRLGACVGAELGIEAHRTVREVGGHGQSRANAIAQ